MTRRGEREKERERGQKCSINRVWKVVRHRSLKSYLKYLFISKSCWSPTMLYRRNRKGRRKTKRNRNKFQESH